MPIDLPKDKWAGKIREARLGATPAEGGTRSKSITVGGDSTMPYLQYEAPTAHSPVIAVEIKSRTPEDWSPLLSEAWGSVMQDPAAWAKAAEASGADAIVPAGPALDNARAMQEAFDGQTGMNGKVTVVCWVSIARCPDNDCGE